MNHVKYLKALDCRRDFGLKVLESFRTSELPSRDNGNTTYREDHNEAIAHYTRVLAGVGVAGTVIALLTLCVINSQLKEMKSSGIQLDALNRPYVGFDSVILDGVFAVPGVSAYALGVPIKWTNSGKTTTQSLILEGSCQSDIIPSVWPSSFENIFQVPIAPNSSASVATCLISPGNLQTIQKSNTPLYVFGSATYREERANEDIHVTRFCVAIRNIIGDFAQKSLRGSVTTCKEYNCADKECDLQER